jgi:hypothetical protein
MGMILLLLLPAMTGVLKTRHQSLKLTPTWLAGETQMRMHPSKLRPEIVPLMLRFPTQ